MLLLLPWRLWEDVFGPLSMDFSTWIVAGLMIVVGAVWVIVYNADLLLGRSCACSAASGSLAPVLRISMAYPLASRFRTGTTLAMFTLVVFTLVTGRRLDRLVHARASTNDETFGGGFDVRASTGGATPIDDIERALARDARAAAGDDFTVGRVASRSSRSRRRQVGTGRELEAYVRARPRPRLPRAHDVRPRRDRDAATTPPRRSGTRSRAAPGPRGRRRDRSCRGATTSTSPCPPTSG